MTREHTRLINRALTGIFRTVRNSLHPRKSINLRSIEQALTTHYGLKTHSCTCCSSSGRIASAILLCETNEGALYVKLIAPDKDRRERLEDEVNLYDYLNHHGIRAPKVVTTAQGRKLAELAVRRRCYYLIAMRKEDLRRVSPATISHQELRVIATTTARMHQLLRNYAYPFEPSIGAQVSVPSDSLCAVLRSSPNVREFTQVELNWLMQVEEMVTGHLKSNLRVSGLSETLIHGDLHFDNFRLLSDGKLYLFDFAMRFYGPVIYDLAHLVLKLYTHEVITYRRFNELQDVLLTNYHSVNRLTEDDWQALIPYIIWHALASSLHFCRIAARRDCPHKSQQIKRQLQLAEYLLSLPPQNRCARAKHDRSGTPSEFQKVLVKVRCSSRPARGD